jgi:hypothetical protein
MSRDRSRRRFLQVSLRFVLALPVVVALQAVAQSSTSRNSLILQVQFHELRKSQSQRGMA